MKGISGFVFAAALFGLISGCAEQRHTRQHVEGMIEQPGPAEEEGRRAVAALQAKSGSEISGRAVFTEGADGRVTLVLEVENAPPGPKAVHIHEFGDCGDPKAMSAGDHWNPTDAAHGKLHHTEEAHLGDIGNIEIGQDGRGRLEFTTDKWSIGGPPETNIVGRSIIVHAEADDFETQPTGGAGDRIGCGVILN
jgi:superoxide dismutase, Cu-Zn family